MKKLILLLAVIGVVDAGYLTYEHYSHVIVPCTTQLSLVDCGVVLRSSYSVIFGIPLALLGFAHYALLLTWLALSIFTKKIWPRYLALIESTAGAIFSVYLVYLQLVILQSICVYCMLSAIVSWLLFILVLYVYSEERKRMVIWVAGKLYTSIVKPIFFMFDPELVHTTIVRLGEISASIPGVRQIERWSIHQNIPELSQKIEGITFPLPIGLAAGFDYEARVTQALAPLGFGFQTVGTITNLPWSGNDSPRLGRLPKSKSLMVNKGFRNPGADAVIRKLQSKQFDIPVGISIGDPKGNIDEIVEALKKFEQADIRNAYYELNISCPNLHGAMSFYNPRNLKKLLSAVDAVKLTRPVWVKMPINLSDKEILTLLNVIEKHSPSAVIFGNLQHDRNNPSFNATEVQIFPLGNFSGKPTYARSNELIALTRKHYKSRFTIVGCGGVFTAEDAFTKIALGANLVQMITGMIFEGPQVVAGMNLELKDILNRNGHTHISNAVGSDTLRPANH